MIMTHQARSALVLQGGGALGAYELGAARALYKDDHFSPDMIAGVSIGAVTAVLLARPERMKNLHFANKSLADLKMLDQFNEVAKLMEAIENLPGGNPLKDDPAYEAVKKRDYVHVPRIVSITSPEPVSEFADADFSPSAIQRRADEGYAQTMKALRMTR